MARLLMGLLVSGLLSQTAFGEEAAAETESEADSLFTWSYARPWVTPAAEHDRIVTDRPHLAEATSTVGLGRAQLETGYSFAYDRSGDERFTSHSLPEPLLRVGAFAEWFELRLGTNALVEQNRAADGTKSTVRGADDLYVGAKVALFKQYGWLPDFTVFPQVRLPVGSDGISAEEVRPGVNLAYSWAVNELIEVECNTVLGREFDMLGSSYLEVFQTVNIEYDIHERVMLFTEYAAFAPTGDAEVPFENYFHYGVHFFLTPDLQLDLHSAVGLNAPSQNLAYTGAGLSYRF